MKFFIPYADDERLAEKTYQAIISFAKDTMRWDVKNRKIFKISYSHNGKNHIAEVGRITDTNGEPVIAILESNAYLICTPNRGVQRGMPILVGQEEAFSVIDFDECSTDPETRLKEIDGELEKIQKLFEEYRSWHDEKTQKTRFPPGKYFDYDKMVEKENELLEERKIVKKRLEST